MDKIVCVPKVLTPVQAALAQRRGIEINPRNIEEQRTVVRTPIGRRKGPRRLAVVIGRRWPSSGVDLSVQFLDTPPKNLRARILAHMNAWSEFANVRFRETREQGEVRITRLDAPAEMAGYWSYVGTEILGIDSDQPTMNLDGFTMHKTDAEFRRVVRHEAGHTLGFDHEHMRTELVNRIDHDKAVAYFDELCGWTAEETEQQVLTPLAKRSILGTTEVDPHSIMCYQVPASITKDRKAIPGGRDINSKDAAFAAKIYPRPEAAHGTAETATEIAETASPVLLNDSAVCTDTFHLVVLDPFQHDINGKKTPAGGPLTKPDFLRIFASYSGARVTAAMRVHKGGDGQTTRFGRIIATHERIKDYTNRVAGTLPCDADMMKFGSDLFETLFIEDVRRLYDEARSRQHARRLDLVLTSMVPWIGEKPWEFAYDASRRSFLATEDLHFVRNVLTPVPADAVTAQAGPLRILVASAQPTGFGQLSIEQEEKVIRRGFQGLIDSGAVEVDILARATPSRIHDALETGRYTAVHFIGHGEFDEKTEQGYLVFEDERGMQSRLGERSVREIFCKRNVRLVFLNSCQSGTGGRADFNQGVAQSLVAHGLPALVANQYSVLDVSATAFAQYFYASLAQGRSIGHAAREARIAVNYSLHGELIDWAVPVVYARDPGMTLVDAATIAPRARARKADTPASKRRALRVAVWDMDNAFPMIEDVLVRMNAAQSRVNFRFVDLSAPVDVWDVESKTRNGMPYLWAERLAERMRRVPLELDVHVLACLTRHWLRDDDRFNLYGWWPKPEGPPIVVFSCAGFEALPPEGPDTDRVVANALVTALAGYLGGLGTHEGGEPACPMARNPGRELQHLIESQRFDAPCRERLASRLPQELAAFEAISASIARG